MTSDKNKAPDAIVTVGGKTFPVKGMDLPEGGFLVTKEQADIIESAAHNYVAKHLSSNPTR